MSKKTIDKDLSEEELVELKHKAREVLSSVRHRILVKYPFIGSVAMSMDMIPVRDIRVNTACTDGNDMYFNIAFLSSLNDDERQFVLAHEVWHAVLLHLVRRHSRDAQLFNIATDMEVNYMLTNDGFKMPSGCLLPEKGWEGKCAEEIYELLLKKQKKNKNANGSASDSGSPGSGKSNDSDSSKSDQLSGQFDKHVYDSDAENEPKVVSDPKELGITDKYGRVGFDKDFKPKVGKDFADKMRETIVSSAQYAEMVNKGDLPANVKALVAKTLTPEVKWEEVLAQFVTQCYHGSIRKWIPPNRRRVHEDLYIQSRHSSKIRLVMGIDTSGSTSNDRGKFLGELVSLVKSFGSFELTLIECDAEIGSVNFYTQDDDISSIIENGEYEMTGGGGTAMEPIFDYVNENHIDADCICIMTDGYIDNIPKNPTGLPTLWVITKNGTEDFCDWGQKIRLKTNDDE